MQDSSKKMVSSIVLIFLQMVVSYAVAQEKHKEKIWKLWYNAPAPDLAIIYKDSLNKMNIVEASPVDAAWEEWSLPLGNGYLGASIFGRTKTERIQLTENSMAAKSLYGGAGLTNFAELYMDFNHNNPKAYQRSLILNKAISTVRYQQDGVTYKREYFASYPDKALVIRLTADKNSKISFTLRPEIPYQKEFGKTSGFNGRKGKVNAKGDLITLSGNAEYLGIKFEGQFKVIPSGGTLTAVNDENGNNGKLVVKNANSVTVMVAVGTNYILNSSIFLEGNPSKKLAANPDPHLKVTNIIKEASKLTYAQLWQNHQRDFTKLFSRVNISLNSKIPEIPTDQLLKNYRKGSIDHYLEELYFQYGRYLLICSSRKGTLPPNLQGIWSQYEVSPWTGGYWHNINIQMNYWPVFNTNLSELFQSFVDYNLAYRTQAEGLAEGYIKKYNPIALSNTVGDNGWTIGTGANAYSIGGPGGHSGPGTGGLTAKLFWDDYDFNRDTAMLKKIDYPAIGGMAKFLSKVVTEQGKFLLTSPSYSPEQRKNITGDHYQTIGCAFDQEMIFENHSDLLKASKILNYENDFVETLKAQIVRLDPIQIGSSGQIKEYREENFYGEIGDPHHRHISHLVGLYPGTIINSTTPAWLDAAKKTLELRGDLSTGWAMAHRLNLWARVKDGNRAYKIYQNLLQKGTSTNLWDTHPPFQIDGNFGGTAGVAEMLLQSHEGYIDILPALPELWSTGFFDGLVARGNFEVSVEWMNNSATKISIKSKKGGVCKIHYPGIGKSNLTTPLGKKVVPETQGGDFISFETKPGDIFQITQISPGKSIENPKNVKVNMLQPSKIAITWDKVPEPYTYSVYVHFGNSPTYERVQTKIKLNKIDYTFSKEKPNLIKVTSVGLNGKESKGVYLTINP